MSGLRAGATRRRQGPSGVGEGQIMFEPQSESERKGTWMIAGAVLAIVWLRLLKWVVDS